MHLSEIFLLAAQLFMKKRLRGQAHFEWFEKGNEDILSAASILKHRDGSPSTVCFLAQQTAEKFLKGALLYFKQDIFKVHDLLQLETKLLARGILTDSIHGDLITLNRYYIETRYPGDYPEFSWKEAREAFEAAEGIRCLILEITK